MPNPIKVRTSLDGDVALIRMLISHPMETGLRKGADGNLVPAHFIQLLSVTYGDRTVLSAQWGRAISRNPYLAFRFNGAAKGGKLKITWTDNIGDTQTDEVTI
ncbi:MAG TPA: thiosulfate oxidation carrier complex protein SoxZ [Burkholderiales bacterium]|nr:thiosulfate oxidation carrier complex protein SoxZ [Burkholderiales bacterium]